LTVISPATAEATLGREPVVDADAGGGVDERSLAWLVRTCFVSTTWVEYDVGRKLDGERLPGLSVRLASARPPDPVRAMVRVKVPTVDCDR
jgi:hypothetical protein